MRTWRAGFSWAKSGGSSRRGGMALASTRQACEAVAATWGAQQARMLRCSTSASTRGR